MLGGRFVSINMHGTHFNANREAFFGKIKFCRFFGDTEICGDGWLRSTEMLHKINGNFMGPVKSLFENYLARTFQCLKFATVTEQPVTE